MKILLRDIGFLTFLTYSLTHIYNPYVYIYIIDWYGKGAVLRVYKSGAARREDQKQTTETFFVFPDLFDHVDL